MRTYVRARAEDAHWFGTGVTVGELMAAAKLARDDGDERRKDLLVRRARAESNRRLQEAREQ